jgi:hypothetical protein
MFDPVLERKKTDRTVSQTTMRSLRLSGLIELAILAVVGFAAAVLVIA